MLIMQSIENHNFIEIMRHLWSRSSINAISNAAMWSPSTCAWLGDSRELKMTSKVVANHRDGAPFQMRE